MTPYTLTELEAGFEIRYNNPPPLDRVVFLSKLKGWTREQAELVIEILTREHKEAESVESEFLRPSDSWLTYIVQDGLRTTIESYKDNLNSYSLSTAKENNPRQRNSTKDNIFGFECQRKNSFHCKQYVHSPIEYYRSRKAIPP